MPPMEIGDGIVLARDKFDVGLLTEQPDAALGFWSGERGFAVERTIEPYPGIVQHKLDMHGAVFKVNGLAPSGMRPPHRNGLRLLRVAEVGIDEPRHAQDPDGNLVELVAPGAGVRSFGVHFAVSDEDACTRWYEDVLRLEPTGVRTYDCAGADISFSWSPDAIPGLVGGALGYLYLTIQVMDAYAATDLLVSRGATVVQPTAPVESQPGTVMSLLADPDGNILEISQRPDLVAAALATGR